MNTDRRRKLETAERHGAAAKARNTQRARSTTAMRIAARLMLSASSPTDDQDVYDTRRAIALALTTTGLSGPALERFEKDLADRLAIRAAWHKDVRT